MNSCASRLISLRRQFQSVWVTTLLPSKKVKGSGSFELVFSPDSAGSLMLRLQASAGLDSPTVPRKPALPVAIADAPAVPQLPELPPLPACPCEPPVPPVPGEGGSTGAGVQAIEMTSKQ